MDLLMPFLPIDRRYAIAYNTSLPDVAEGAVLFADISGFTQLTGQLTRTLGAKQGVEQLINVLNDVFTRLIDEIHANGGSVLTFSGDGITCWFPEQLPFEAKQSGASLRAITAGLNLQKIMTSFSDLGASTENESELSIKVAIAHGRVRRFLVGIPEIQLMDVIAGTPVDEVEIAEQLTDPGQVLVTFSTVKNIGENLSVKSWKQSANGDQFGIVGLLRQQAEPIVWPEIPDLDEGITKKWILPVVHNRLLLGQETFLTELRQVVPLFLHFTGIDYEEPEAGDQLNKFIGWVQTVVNRYKGTLQQLVMGDKGSYLISVFGAPESYEKDTEYAVQAALTLSKPPAQLDFIQEIKIGLSRGQVRAGLFGSSRRRIYGIHGPDVNLAARMMMKAQSGQVLITKRIIETLPTGKYQWHTLQPLEFKGIKDPVNMYALYEGISKAGQQKINQVAFINRSVELDMMGQYLTKLKNEGHGQIIVIEGEAGIGKSRFIQEVQKMAGSHKIKSLYGLATAVEQSTAFYIWRGIFRKVLNLAEAPLSESKFQEYILSQLTPGTSNLERLPMLNAVLPVSIPDNELTVQMKGEVRADNILEMLQHVLHAYVKDEPYLIILEDAQWMDPSSWALVRLLNSKISNLLFIVETRLNPEPTTDDLLSLRTDPGSECLKLEPLTHDFIEKIIGQSLGIQEVPASVTSLILERVGGSPFLAEEMSYAMSGTGLIEVVNGTCRIASVDGKLKMTDLPDTIEGLITSRLDRLSPNINLILKIASIMGRRFDAPTLEKLLPFQMDISELEKSLNELINLNLLVKEGIGQDIIYRFSQNIIQEVAYNLMTFSQRSKLHQKAAVLLEQNHANHLMPYYHQLAYHWSKTQEIAKAIYYSELSGEQMVNNGAYREGEQLFLQTIELSKANPTIKIDDTRRARWHWKLGQAYNGLGLMPESQAQLELAVRLYGHPLPSSTLKLVGGIILQLLRQLLFRISPVKRSKTSTFEQSKSLDTSRIYRDLVDIYFFASLRGHHLYAALYSLNQAEIAGPSYELAQAYITLSVFTGVAGMHKISDSYYQRAIKVANEINSDIAVAFVQHGSSIYQACIGQWERSRMEAEEASKIYRRLGDKKNWGYVQSQIGGYYHYIGDFTRSLEVYTENHIQSLEIEHTILQIQSLTWKSGAYLYLHELEKALLTANEALLLLKEGIEPLSEITTYGFLSLTYWRSGDIEQARSTALTINKLINQSGSAPSGYHSIDGYAIAAEIFLYLVESGQMENIKHVKTALKNLANYKRFFAIGQPSYYRCLGLWYWLNNKEKKALKIWKKGLLKANEMGMVYEKGRICFEIARHMNHTDTERKSYLENAASIFNVLKTRYDLEKVEAISLF
jgi:class 3 adenylate cyclase/tetratricopeptide (TPR) repeat protein